jgi:hypothetical protein
MNPTVLPYSEWIAILTGLVAAATPGWLAATCGLYQNNFQPVPTMTLGSLVEASFTGYSMSSAITWGTPGFLPSGPAVVTGDTKTFRVGATPTVFNTIYGYYIVDSTGLLLIAARLFDSPIVLSAAGQIIEVIPGYVSYQSQ